MQRLTPPCVRGFAICLALLALGGVALAADEAGHLRIATFKIAEPPAVTEPAAAPSRQSYRHTFGSERQSAPAERRLPAAIGADTGADIILLQGVSDAAQLRKAYPPSNWSIVLSRQLLQNRPRDVSANPPRTGGTAIVVHRSKTRHVVRQDHEPAFTAAIVRAGEARIWIVSADFDECSPSCPEARFAALLAWIGAHRDASAVVIGGPGTANLSLQVTSEGALRGGPLQMDRPASAESIPVTMSSTLARVEAPDPKRCGDAGRPSLLVVAGTSHMTIEPTAWVVQSGEPRPSCAALLDVQPQ